MEYPATYNKDQLKAYTDKWYNSNVQSATAKNQAKQDLRYVINPKDAEAIATNNCIKQFNGIRNFLMPEIRYDSLMRGWVMAGSTSTMDLVQLAYSSHQKVCHKYYADNVSYDAGRFKFGSKDCVYRLLELFQAKNQFDPRAFISNGYK